MKDKEIKEKEVKEKEAKEKELKQKEVKEKTTPKVSGLTLSFTYRMKLKLAPNRNREVQQLLNYHYLNS